jgi:hypothetical protein
MGYAGPRMFRGCSPVTVDTVRADYERAMSALAARPRRRRAHGCPSCRVMPARRSESPSRPRVPRRRLHRLAPAAREAVANPGRARAPDRAIRRCAPCSRETSPRARGARLLGPRTAPKPGSWTWRPPRGRQTRARRSERTEPLMRFERTVVKCASRRTSQKAQAAAEGLPERRPLSRAVASRGVHVPRREATWKAGAHRKRDRLRAVRQARYERKDEWPAVAR